MYALKEKVSIIIQKHASLAYQIVNSALIIMKHVLNVMMDMPLRPKEHVKFALIPIAYPVQHLNKFVNHVK